MRIATGIANFLNQYFDKILIVTLPRFTDRQHDITENLSGLAFEFFWGEDKLLLNFDTLKTNGIYDDHKSKQITRHGKEMNMGEITCSLSHRKLYNAMVANGWKRVLVFEDDVLPRYDDLQYLPAAFAELPDDWELIYLGYLKHETITPSLKAKQFFYKIFSLFRLMKWNFTMAANLLPKPYSRYLKKAGIHDCTHAYAITLSAAKKLVEEQTPVAHRADDLLSYLTANGKLHSFVTEPKFFDQEWFNNPDAISVKTI